MTVHFNHIGPSILDLIRVKVWDIALNNELKIDNSKQTKYLGPKVKGLFLGFQTNLPIMRNLRIFIYRDLSD